ncbi:MAG: hypothetical protein F2787_03865 [Actinobacteria bacterium]|uniref:Unannotated protein n=1 Tax=freshwater metagenome TaxID=449393 RepID=A0A6J6TFL8_9ZZZZ|nr:hypothetical protein [Actinomycetota bacterium]MSX24890.1 hypothetical protein [Actinomycetota bacterium]
MIAYTITSGTPTLDELAALEFAFEAHKRPEEILPQVKSVWAKPALREPLDRKA